jgi:signal peptidase II
MKSPQTRPITQWLFLSALLLVLLDQWSKIMIKGFNLFGWQHQGMYPGESFPVIGEFLRCTFVENPGMAFGVEFGPAKILLTMFSLIATIALAFYLRKINTAHRMVQAGIMLIMAGAFGNYIDRMFYGWFYGESPLFYGLVVDFIQIDIPDITFNGITYTHWPVFNVADSCVTVGMFLLILFNSHIPLPGNQIMTEGEN